MRSKIRSRERADVRDADGFMDCWPDCTVLQEAVEFAFIVSPVMLVVVATGRFAAFGVGVVEEQRRAGVHGGDEGQLVGGELEVEDVDVLAHALGANGLGDDDDVALDEPAQDDLGDGLAVRGTDLAEDGVGEDVVLAFGERAPGLDLHAVLAHDRLVGDALVERVRLDLVDGRRDLVVGDEVQEPVG